MWKKGNKDANTENLALTHAAVRFLKPCMETAVKYLELKLLDFNHFEGGQSRIVLFCQKNFKGENF